MQEYKAIPSALKWPGGKFPLADRIVALFPPKCLKPNSPAADDPGYIHYCEPYFGSGAVLFANNPEGISECINDLNYELTNFWKVLQDERWFLEFQRVIQAVPFSEVEFNDSDNRNPKPVANWSKIESAISFFINCRQSLAGRMAGFAGVSKTRTRRGMNEQVAAWLTAVEGLPEVHKRLKRVLILNRPAIQCIKSQDDRRALFYIDAPYMHSTRSTTKEYGDLEMADDQHQELINTLVAIKGRALVSMYHHPIYDALHLIHGWRLHEFDVPNNAAGGLEKERKTECLWLNY